LVEPFLFRIISSSRPQGLCEHRFVVSCDGVQMREQRHAVVHEHRRDEIDDCAGAAHVQSSPVSGGRHANAIESVHHGEPVSGREH
jgi:hypothetical protein